MLDFVNVHSKDFFALASFASELWKEHYTAIIGEAQVKYMLENFQSASAIKRQVDEGYEYFFIRENGISLGYFSFRNEEGKMFLSKLYLKKDCRGKGFSKNVLSFLINVCKENGLKSIYLTVNKNNFNSIKAYERLGFYKKDEVKTDIGSGYYMDDYIMQKDIDWMIKALQKK